ncbi:branched-chain amino acid ABC transporter permease [Leucobacter chromiiresistens]|uniref:Amino acid/amide ABC transporter membrane protein 2, HAAT family n=1 Tax=Leucobacter chromiiresistens TaxID=1079994 RepID=A0A1H1A648_9MICO|nr:branched-chain amino acid ABC transporter permease [Leucobacter chromiiresistens]SDQ35124.1 amino acid/amide ABC transporter membrane protein 2, HAAT family [Leucobacter chromiiresistens]
MEFWTGLLQSILQTALSPTTAAFVLAAIGLNVHFGFTGLMNMGQAGFMLVGAYGFGVSVVLGAGFWTAMLIAILAAVLFALILGIPTLKLRGDYLAIVTISAAEIIRMVVKLAALQDVTGGPTGIPGQKYRHVFTELSPLPEGKTTILGLTYANTGVDDWWTRLVAWGLVAVFILITWALVRSPWGRVLKGIREDEDAVRSLGKSSFSYKLQALILGGVMGAFGGIVMALPAAMQPDSMGRPTTFNLWMIMLLGGAATIFGPLLGSILFFVIRLVLTSLAGEFVPASVLSAQQTEQLAWILIGISLILLVVFRPQGILGNKKELSFNV